MMDVAPPARRIWLYASSDCSIEVFIFGELAEIAQLFAAVKTILERHPGFGCVAVISGGSTVGGMRAWLTMRASHDDPIAEALLAIGEKIPSIEWAPVGGRVGTVGTW